MTAMSGTRSNFPVSAMAAVGQERSWRRGVLQAFVLCGLLTSMLSAETPSILPTPKVLKMGEGAMPLTAQSRIIVSDAKLQPLATILSDEIDRLTGLKLSANNLAQVAQDGDIVLKINTNLTADEDILTARKEAGKASIARSREHAHTIEIGKSAVVEGWDYRAVCEGTATLLQAISGGEGSYSLPRLSIKDWPYADYSGTMIDVARQRIPLDVLKAVVQTCRLGKVRYLHLHLTDNEAFTFPSTAFPKLGSKNEAMHGGLVPQVYKLEELRELVAYADARGVTLIPELATPNHTAAMRRAMPEVFGGPKILNLTSDEMYAALDTLVGEMCDVFQSSPYFHIGCEDMYFYELAEHASTKEYLEKKGMKHVDELFTQHILRMSEMIRKRGKVMLAWEGIAAPSEGRPFTLPESLRDQVVPMCWFPWPSAAENLQKQGFATITVPWDRGDSLLNWTLHQSNGAKLDPAKTRVLGGAITMWQMSAHAVVSDFLGGNLNGSSTEGYIRSQHDHMEGTWAPLTAIDPAARKKQLQASRAKLESLLFPVKAASDAIAYRGWPLIGNHFFNGDVNVSLTLLNPKAGGAIHYTLDGTEPSLQSSVYNAPVNVDSSATVQAALFRNGVQVGAVTRIRFEKLDDDGALAKWLVAGPYKADGKGPLELFDMPFDPETTGKAEWQAVNSGKVNFSAVQGLGGNDRVAYMKTQIYSPKTQKARLLVASDDGAKVFLNGKVVHTANLLRPSWNADTIEVELKEGWNPLMVKVTNGAEGWEAWVKVRDLNGAPLEKVRAKAE